MTKFGQIRRVLSNNLVIYLYKYNSDFKAPIGGQTTELDKGDVIEILNFIEKDFEYRILTKYGIAYLHPIDIKNFTEEIK